MISFKYHAGKKNINKKIIDSILSEVPNCWAWPCGPRIPSLNRGRQEGPKFKASLDYIVSYWASLGYKVRLYILYIIIYYLLKINNRIV